MGFFGTSRGFFLAATTHKIVFRGMKFTQEAQKLKAILGTQNFFGIGLSQIHHSWMYLGHEGVKQYWMQLVVCCFATVFDSFVVWHLNLCLKYQQWLLTLL